MKQEPVRMNLSDYRQRSFPRRLVGQALCAAGFHKVPNYLVRTNTGEASSHDVLDGHCVRQDCRERVVKFAWDFTWTIFRRKD